MIYEYFDAASNKVNCLCVCRIVHSQFQRCLVPYTAICSQISLLSFRFLFSPLWVYSPRHKNRTLYDCVKSKELMILHQIYVFHAQLASSRRKTHKKHFRPLYPRCPVAFLFPIRDCCSCVCTMLLLFLWILRSTRFIILCVYSKKRRDPQQDNKNIFFFSLWKREK